MVNSGYTRCVGYSEFLAALLATKSFAGQFGIGLVFLTAAAARECDTHRPTLAQGRQTRDESLYSANGSNATQM
jgi:hypothetical protein